MYYSTLEYIVGSSYSNSTYNNVSYFSKNIDDNYDFRRENTMIFEPSYPKIKQPQKYKNQQKYASFYSTSHLFAPDIFLKPFRPKSRFIVDIGEVMGIVNETFELMMKDALPSISIEILPFDEFRLLHSSFGSWSNGILGFSINSKEKKIFVREKHLDALILVIGHEIGHVLTVTLPNKHDEEAKAFAFSIAWAKTIREHNIANLGSSIKDDFDFQPARNGLHDVAFNFVDLMVKKGRKVLDLHHDLVRKYISLFNKFYI